MEFLLIKISKGGKEARLLDDKQIKKLVKQSTGRKQATRMEFGVGVGEWFAIFK